jgi:hypothetical protein
MLRSAVLVALLVLASPAWAANPALVQGKGNSAASSATVTVTLDANGTSGNLLACGHASNSQAVTWTPSNNGTSQSWTTVGGAPFNGGNGTLRLYVWYTFLSSGDVSAVTATRSSGTASTQLWCVEVSSIATMGTVDQTGTDDGTGTNDLDASITTTSAVEFLYTLVGSTTAASWTGDASGFTDVDSALPNGTASSQAQYRVVTSTGTYSTDGTVAAASENAFSVIVSFLGSDQSGAGGGGGGGTCGARALVGVGC